jgi:hypothetical protein
VPGTPVSGLPTAPGAPDVPLFGALPDVPDELALVPESLVPLVPGIAPTPGEPEVAVPTEPAPEVEGRSAPLVMSRSVLPELELAPDVPEDCEDWSDLSEVAFCA